MDPVIEVKGLRKSFGRREVLHGIDFDVERGEVFGVIGPNGAGKTTTMRCLLDIIRPNGGTIRILGENPSKAVPDSGAGLDTFRASCSWSNALLDAGSWPTTPQSAARFGRDGLTNWLSASTLTWTDILASSRRATNRSWAWSRHSCMTPRCWCLTSPLPASIP